MTMRDRAQALRARGWFEVRPWSRHSLVLLVAGWSCIAVGLGYHYVIPGGPRWLALVVARKLMPMDGWVIVWIAVGLLVILSARWPPMYEKWGYSVLTGLCTGWGAFHLLGMPFVEDWQSSFISVVVWSLLGFLWWAIAGLNNPPNKIEIVAVIKDG